MTPRLQAVVLVGVGDNSGGGEVVGAVDGDLLGSDGIAPVGVD